MTSNIYKGAGVERETRHLLKQHDDFSHWIDSYKPESDKDLAIVNAGRGQFPLLFALVHPKIQIHSFTTDIDDVALASSCSLMPPNLSIHYCPDTKESVELAKNYQIINFEYYAKKQNVSRHHDGVWIYLILFSSSEAEVSCIRM